jgi:ketosteroid isomerase-like protein
MRTSTIAFAFMLSASAWGATSAAASDTADIAATINQYNNAFNKNDIKAADALCTSQTIIIDDFAPHAWQGATTCGDWWKALSDSDKKSGITDGIVTLEKAWHVTATGDRGYADFPAHYSYKLNGKPVVEQGVWTFAMQKTAAGWRIAGWAWAQH